MLIGEFSKCAGISSRLIRYYEDRKLLSPQRDKNGYRIYTEANMKTLSLIRMYLSLGIKTEDAGRLLSCESNSARNPLCPAASHIYQNQLSDINHKIEILLHARRILENKLSSHERKPKNDH